MCVCVYLICSVHYCVFQVLGYICMVVYGLTALVSYRHWRIQYRLYQRRKLLEEDEIDLWLWGMTKPTRRERERGRETERERERGRETGRQRERGRRRERGRETERDRERASHSSSSSRVMFEEKLAVTAGCSLQRCLHRCWPLVLRWSWCWWPWSWMEVIATRSTCCALGITGL